MITNRYSDGRTAITSHWRIARRFFLLLVTLTAAGCASVDFDYPREPSYALTDTDDTTLGEVFGDRLALQDEDVAGFRPVLEGIDALAARLALAERAERSIDVQYYLIKNDVVGGALMESLLRAADRGVRVRVLLDDVFTSGYDTGMAALDHHPNIHIRIFNPFNRGFAGRVLGSATDFGRVNRRMHNKSFTVDNQVTVIGGRNIADEYFDARQDINFGDLDVIAIGPIVGEVSAMFDTYWNHETALPVPAFYDKLDDPDQALENVREYLAGAYDRAPTEQYDKVIRDRFSGFLDDSTLRFSWAPYRLVYDSPDKGLKDRDESTPLLVNELFSALGAADEEMIIVSPYFVPLDDGVDSLRRVREREIDVTVITNSLAANNQFSVHAGYGPSRKPLLESGVQIFEVRPDATMDSQVLVAASGARATLHTKAFIVDREEIFIGSFNFDPRSAYINTEMGVLIRDHELAVAFADYIHQKLPEQTYTVFLDPEGDLRWRATRGDEDVVYAKEPETSWWDRFVVGFVGIFPVDKQL